MRGEVRALSPGMWRDGMRCRRDTRLRDRLRPAGAGDFWLGEAPSREQIEERLGDDAEAKSVLFDWSMAGFVEKYLEDERLQIAYLGQGVIGTNASPFDKARRRFVFIMHRAVGRMPACGATCAAAWMVSFIFATRRGRRERRWSQACRWRRLCRAKACGSKVENGLGRGW